FDFFFFQAEDGIRVFHVTGVQTCALPISSHITSDRRLSPINKLFWVSICFSRWICCLSLTENAPQGPQEARKNIMDKETGMTIILLPPKEKYRQMPASQIPRTNTK